jgi:hypothetical protein
MALITRRHEDTKVDPSAIIRGPSEDAEMRSAPPSQLRVTKDMASGARRISRSFARLPFHDSLFAWVLRGIRWERLPR